jgi:predicted HD phosphohydrolase
MADMTAEDFRLIEEYGAEIEKTYPDRLLAAVANLANYQGPELVSRMEHSLQSASRAHRDGKDEKYVAAALLHDIGDELAPSSHGPMVGAILKPYVGERIAWIVEKHGLFQAYYYAHLYGGDRNARDKYKDHPYYDDCAEFCEKYDQNCFDPDYESLPLEFFEPIMRRVFGRPLATEEMLGD